MLARMSPRETIDLAPQVEKAFLVAVDTGDDAVCLKALGIRPVRTSP